MTKKLKSLEIFNTLTGLKITEAMYANGTALPDESVKILIEGYKLSTDNNLSIAVPSELMNILKSMRTGTAIDVIAYFFVKAIADMFYTASSAEELISGTPTAISVRNTLKSKLEDIAEDIILEGKIAQESRDEMTIKIYTQMFNVIDLDREFYGFTPTELFLGRLSERNAANMRISEMSAPDFARYIWILNIIE